MKPLHTNRKIDAAGFSLIETLVAISILLIVVVGAMTLVVTTSKQVEFSGERIEATFLAQDAVEYIISKKQQNVIDGDSDWLDGFEPCIKKGGATKICDVDTAQDPSTTDSPDNNVYAAVSCSGGSCPVDPLRYDPVDKHFGHDSGEETKYTREVVIEEITSDEARVTVTVSWRSRETGLTEKFVLKTNLYNTRL